MPPRAINGFLLKSNNNLNLLIPKKFLFFLNNEDKKSVLYLSKFSKLLRITLENSRDKIVPLHQELEAVNNYLELQNLEVSQSYQYTILVDDKIDTSEFYIPPMLIQPFVENAIRHGILKGPREGALSITFTNTEDILTVIITDNGVGIFNSQQQKPKTDHQSMALTVTRERLESISGANALEMSEIKLEDGSIGGTTIVFKIPLETDY